jgi:hypothetical protein
MATFNPGPAATIGNDTISALGATETVDGLAGTDTLLLSANYNTAKNVSNVEIVNVGVTAGLSVNWAAGVAGITLNGNTGADTLSGSNFADMIYGGDGDDRIAAAQGNDYVEGGVGNDTLGGGRGFDTLLGGDGADSLAGSQNDDVVRGGDGNDILDETRDTGIINTATSELSPAGNNLLAGGAGNDTIYGGFGQDTIQGGIGDDLLFGNGGNDTIYTGAGTDTVFGGLGGDTIYISSLSTVTTLVINTSNQGIDGVDVVYGFRPGIDKILLIDKTLGLDPYNNSGTPENLKLTGAELNALALTGDALSVTYNTALGAQEANGNDRILNFPNGATVVLKDIGVNLTKSSFVGSTGQSLSVPNITLAEGDSGTTAFTFNLKFAAPSPVEGYQLSYQTLTTGTATAGTDFIADSGFITFNKGDQEKTLTVLVNGDTLKENNETFQVKFSGDSLDDVIATGTITNDDNPPVYTLASSATTVTEGNEITFTVTADRALTTDTILNFNISGDTNNGALTAAAAADFGTLSGQVTIPANLTTGTFKVTPTSDGVTEGLEGFKVSLFDSNGNNVRNSANTLLISDGASSGSTFTLTTAADIVPGTAGDDTINGGLPFASTGSLDSTATLTAGDQITGGAGNDTLNIAISGASTTQGSTAATPSLSGIERVRVNNVATDAANGREVTIDMSLTDSSLTSVGTASSTSAGVETKFTNVGSLTAVEMAGKGDLTVSFSSSVVSGTADAVTVSVNGVGTSTALTGQFTTSGVETVNLVSNTSNNYIDLVDTAAKTVNISGSKALHVDLNAGSNTSISKVDASAATGNVSVNAAAASGNVNLIGGKGSDTFYVGTNLGTADTISGGDGTADTLALRVDSSNYTLNSSYTNISGIERVALTANRGSSIASVVDVTGLSGITTVATGNQPVLAYSFSGVTLANLADDVSISINGYTITQDSNFASTAANDISAGLATKITADSNMQALGISASNSGGVLTLTAADGVTGVNISSITYSQAPSANSPTGATLNDYTFNNLPTGSTLEVFAGTGGNAVGTVAVDDVVTSLKDSSATTDTMTVKLMGSDSTLNYTAGSIQIDAGVESLTLNSGGALQSTKTNTVTALAASATNLKTLTITGDSNLTIGATASGASNLTAIDASALTGKLDITVSQTSNVSITGGSNNDTLRFGSTLNASDTVNGGDGSKDVLTADVGGLTATTGILNVSNVETLNLVAGSSATVDVSKVSGANLISFSGDSTVNLTKLASGATVGLGNNTGSDNDFNSTLTASLADATGTADTLNLVLNTAVDQTGVVLKTSGIETLNITGGTDPSTGSALTLANNTLDLTNSDASTVKIAATSFGTTKTVTLQTPNKALTTVDASGIKGADFAVTLNSSIASEATVTGGEGNNTLSASGASKAVTFNINAAFDGSDVITGGSATNDVLNATFSSTATVSAASKITGVETVNFTVGNGVTATYSDADDLATPKTITVAGGNSNSAFKITDTSVTLAFATNTTTFDASGFNGTVDVYSSKAMLASAHTLKGGAGSSDFLRIDTANDATLTTSGGVSGFENIVLASSSNDSGKVNLTGVTGASNIYAVGGNSLEVTNLASGVTVNLGAAGSSSQYSTTADFADGKTLKVGLASVGGTADALTVKLNNVAHITSGQTLDVDGVENLTLTAANAYENFLLAVTQSNGTTNTNDQSIALTGGKAGLQVSFSGSSAIPQYVKTVTATDLTSDFIMASASARGRSGTMTITGGQGDDTIVMKNDSDVLDGGTTRSAGDTLVVAYNQILGGIKVDLSATADQVTTLDGSANSAVQKGFENVDLSGITGAFGANITTASTGSSITGTSNGDVINGGAGNDVIRGGGGADTVSLSTGSDTVVFEATASANGVDTISNFSGGTTAGTADVLNFSAFADFGMGTGFVTTDASMGDGMTLLGSDGQVALIVDSTLYSNFSAADLSSASAAGDVALGSDIEAVVIIADSTSASTAKIYYVDVTGTAGSDGDDTVTLIGTINFASSTNITTGLTFANFDMS